MFNFLSLFKHLLPRSRVWNITTASNLRSFWLGLAWLPQVFREYIDAIWWDQFAAYTTRLSDQERLWGLPATTATEAERRIRLAARKADTGGQSREYLEAQLRARGFDVWVYDSFVNPPTVPPVAPVHYDPRLYLVGSNFYLVYVAECGEAVAECGEAVAECGNSYGPIGYVLVNNLEKIVPNYLGLCGEAWMEAGEPAAQAGTFDKYLWEHYIFDLPDDPDFWPFFGYIGGEPFGTQATIPAARKIEFETELLRICPERLWLGVMVNYN